MSVSDVYLVFDFSNIVVSALLVLPLYSMLLKSCRSRNLLYVCCPLKGHVRNCNPTPGTLRPTKL